MWHLLVILPLLSSASGVEESLNDRKFRTRAQEKAFIDRLKQNSTAMSPPFGLYNNTVFAIADLYQIVEVDEKLGLISLKIFVYLYYSVPHLEWNITDSVDSVAVPMGTFWVPDVVHYDVTELKYQGFTEQAIFSNGIVVAYSSIQFVKVACSYDISFFPFDTQECKFRVGQWMNDNTSYGLEPGMGEEMELNYYQKSDQWTLDGPVRVKKGSRVWASATFHTVEYTLRLRREPKFYHSVIVLPTIVFLLLSCLTFTLPPECGEKVSLGITVLLAQTVSLLVLMDILPPSSVHFPLLGSFVLFSILLSSMSVVISVLVITIHHSSCDRRLPSAIQWLAGLFNSSPPVHAPNDRDDSLNAIQFANCNGKDTGDFCNSCGETPDDVSPPTCRVDQSEATHESNRRAWARLAVCVDRILLVVYVIMVVSGTVYYSHQIGVFRYAIDQITVF